MICPTKAEALVCPVCGQWAMTESQKFWLSPLRSRQCAACDTRLSIAWADAFFVNWPMMIAMFAVSTSTTVNRSLLHLIEKIFDLPAGVALTLDFVFGLVVPIGLLVALLSWGCVRTLDLGPRIRLVVRGASQSSTKPNAR